MLQEGDSRDCDMISSEEEYLNDSDKTDLVNMCENKYNIDRHKNQMNSVQNSLYNTYNNTSIPNLRRYPPTSRIYENNSQKNLLDYLKEEARQESEKINSQIYMRNSFSPVYEKPLDVPEVKPKAKRGRKPKSIKTVEYSEMSNSDSQEEQRSIEKKKRTYRKRKQLSYDHNDHHSEISDHTNIESFADFADSMFKFHTKDKVKVYECPEPGCFTELPSLSRIKRHYLVHTNLKPFKCLNKNCDKRFSRKDNMIQHFRTHCNSKRNNS